MAEIHAKSRPRAQFLRCLPATREDTSMKIRRCTPFSDIDHSLLDFHSLKMLSNWSAGVSASQCALQWSTGLNIRCCMSALPFSAGRRAREQHFEKGMTDRPPVCGSTAASLQRRHRLNVTPIALAGDHEREELRSKQLRLDIERLLLISLHLPDNLARLDIVHNRHDSCFHRRVAADVHRAKPVRHLPRKDKVESCNECSST